MELRRQRLARGVLSLSCALLWAGAPASAVDPEEGVSPLAAAEPEPGEPAAEEPPAEDSLDLESYWSRRLANAAKRVAVARERVEKAGADYSRARHDRNPRGETLEEIKRKRVAAERELEDAEAALPRLVEQARRAGVPPGVLRDYWDEDGEAE